MTSRSALVVTFDRFPASILGCYGNEWIETPQLDKLAAQGTVADQCWSARVGPVAAEEAFSAATCVSELTARAVHSRLIREADAQVDFSAAKFGETHLIAGEVGSDAKPDKIPLAEMVRAAKAKSTDERARLVWLHANGLSIPALPPAGFGDLYQDEFEDRGVKFDRLSESEQLVHPLVAAGMVSLFDHWLGELFSALAGTQPMLIALTAAQGSAWQTPPNSFGPLDELRSHAAHVPWIVRILHDERGAMSSGHRHGGLLSPRDLCPLLDWWFRSDSDGVQGIDWLAAQSGVHAGRIVTRSASGLTRITTADWAAIFPRENSAVSVKPALFAKPEDFWEVNDIAQTSTEVVEALRDAVAKAL